MRTLIIAGYRTPDEIQAALKETAVSLGWDGPIESDKRPSEEQVETTIIDDDDVEPYLSNQECQYSCLSMEKSLKVDSFFVHCLLRIFIPKNRTNTNDDRLHRKLPYEYSIYPRSFFIPQKNDKRLLCLETEAKQFLFRFGMIIKGK